jgi:hypothetical protein
MKISSLREQKLVSAKAYFAGSAREWWSVRAVFAVRYAHD